MNAKRSAASTPAEWLQETREACLTLARQALPEKRRGTSGGVHLKYVGEAAAVFRLCGSGAVQQFGGELDAPGGAGKKELAARRWCAGRAQSGGHPFVGGILPPTGRSRTTSTPCCPD